MRQEGESSVEEILESIKKVIARDNRTGAVETRRRRESEGMPEPVDSDEADEVLDLSEAELIDEDGDDAIEHEVSMDDVPLMTETVRDSMRENLEALAMIAEPGAQPQIVRSGETSLEGMVREMLRPMLAEWLDKNLPDMVETMVKAEISRIAGKRG